MYFTFVFHGFMNTFLKVMKQPFRRGVNFNYVRINFSSQYCLKTSFDVQKVDQVYSNTRVPTQVNTNQHESDTSQHESNTSQHESTQARHESIRISTNQHESDTSQHESTRINTSQCESIRPRNHHNLL